MKVFFKVISLIFIFLLVSCSGQDCTIVDTVDKLEDIRNNIDKDRCYRITKDLDFGASTSDFWQPIASAPSPFQGKIYGGGHVISNLRIKATRNDAAFIAATGSNALIERLSFRFCSVEGVSYLASVVARNSGELRQVSASCTVVASIASDTGDYVGGLVGENNGTIIGGNTSGSVEGRNYVGGLVGKNNSNIRSSTSNARVIGNNYLGSLVGENADSIERSSASGDVRGIGRVLGGLVGNNTVDAIITNSYATGRVVADPTSADLRSVAGFAGKNSGSIRNSYTTVNAIDDGLVNRARPFVADSTKTGIIQQSYWNKRFFDADDRVAGTERLNTSQMQKCPDEKDSDCDSVYQGWSDIIWDFRTSGEYPIHR